MRHRTGKLRRFGVVLSVLWFVGFFVVLWHDRVGAYREWLKMDWETCMAYAYGRWGSDALETSAYAFDVCAKKQVPEPPLGYQHPASSDVLWKILLLVDLASIALAWLLAWIIVCVGRWVIGAPGKRLETK